MKNSVFLLLSVLVVCSSGNAENLYAPTLETTVVAFDKYERESGIYAQAYQYIMGELLELGREPSCNTIKTETKDVVCVSTDGQKVVVGSLGTEINTDLPDGAFNVQWNDKVEIKVGRGPSNETWYKLVLK